MSEAEKIKKKYESNLMKIKGVTGVGFNGSINVYVERLTPQVASFIPRTLEGVQVRVIETGKIKLLSFPIQEATYPSRTGVVRPPMGGVSVGHLEVTAGTLACAVKDKTGRVLGLSNNHVVALDWGELHVGQKGDPIIQPGVYDGGTIADKIGELERWVRVEGNIYNLIDAALFTVDAINGIEEVGKQSNTVVPNVGMRVKKSGRTTGLTFGIIIDTNAAFNVEGYGEAVFEDQIVVTPFSAPGDSGSWVGDENDRSVGIVFAGSPEVTIVNKAKNIESLLEVEFAPYLPYLPLWQALIPIAIPVPAAIIGGFVERRGERVDS